MLDWIKKNPNKVMSLIWPVYIWSKAFALKRMGYEFLPETDYLLTAILTAVGVSVAATTTTKKP